MSKDKCLGVKINTDDGTLSYKRESGPLAGAMARVETSGDVDRRITATRLLLTGPFAFGLRKKKDHRKVYLTIEGNGFGWAVETLPMAEKACRQFAARVNALAGTNPAAHDAGAASVGATESTASVADELVKLAALRDAGVLSADEFAAQKARLLGA